MTHSPILSGLILCGCALLIGCGAAGSDGGRGTGGGGATGAGGGGSGALGGGQTGAGGVAGVGFGGGSGGGAAAAGGRAGTGGGGGSNGGSSSGGSPAVGGSGGSGGVTSAGSLTFVTSWPNGVILTGVRDVASPLLTQAVHVRGGGAASATIDSLTISGPRQAAFQIAGGPSLPVVLAAGADIPLTIEALTSSSALPAAPPQNSGATLVTAVLTASAASVSAKVNLFGLVLTSATHEPTLGQILVALGYNINVGSAQDNANPISPGDASKLPGIETNSDEISAPLFVKAGTANVTLVPVARFSPKGPMPFGWYPKGSPTTRNVSGTMASLADAQTSDKARMVLPPTTGPQSFDPGSTTFGIWVYTDQLSQKYDTGGIATNGDYSFSEDGPNSPANAHRTKVYPLKDSIGATVANTYLIAVEEAGNGDYQDYVFILGNARVAL